MPNENNLLPEHAQLAAVLDNPEAIQRIKEPTEKVQIAAVQKKPELMGHRTKRFFQWSGKMGERF